MSGLVFGVHPVLEAIKAGRRDVIRVVLAEGRGGRAAEEVVAAARQAGIAVQRQPLKALDRMSQGARHQGIVAVVAASSYADPEEILARAPQPALFVVLDGVQDPRNLGAVIRTAAAAGAHGLFLPSHGAAGLTEAAVKVAAGAAERFPVARAGNIVRLLERLKEAGVWTVGLDAGADRPYTGFDLTAPVALVLGAEDKGLRRLARESCDVVVAVPLAGGVESLNLSVAAGVVLYEVVRQRTASGKPPG